MKRTSNRIIAESIYEGGCSFDNVEGVPGDVAQRIAGDIIADLKKVFGTRVDGSGSTLKKGPNDICGDLDILIDAPYTDENKEKLSNWITEKCPNAQRKEEPGLHLISIDYPFQMNGEQKYVQLDLKMTDNYDWVLPYHSSPSPSDSKFKAMAKNALYRAIASAIPYGDEPDDEFTKHRHLLSPMFGLFGVEKSRIGKSGKELTRKIVAPDGTVTREPRWEEHKDKRVLITKDYEEAAKIALGPEATSKDLYSVETILDYIFSGKFNTNPEQLKEIHDKFLHEMGDFKKSHPETEADFRENQKIEDMLSEFERLWAEHTGKTPLSESRCSRFGMKVNDLTRRMNLL